MEDLSRSLFDEKDSDKESASDKKSKKTRKIGSFAKSSAETTPRNADRKEPPKKLFGIEKETKNKPESTDEDAVDIERTSKKVAEDKPETIKLKNEKLQEDIARRIADHEAVITSSPADSAEHIQASQAKAFEESLQEKASNPELEADPVIEAEYARQLAEIELDEAAEESVDQAEFELSDGEVLDLSKETEDTVDTSTTPVTNSNQTTPKPFVPLPIPTRTTPSPTTPPIPVRPHVGGSAGTGGPTPPINLNPNTSFPMPTNSKERSASLPSFVEAKEKGNERSKKSGAFLVGGLLGYMIGRRGGRKRTEKRLNPEIKQLGKSLEATKERLASREAELKSTIAKQLSRQNVHPNIPKAPQKQETVQQPVNNFEKQKKPQLESILRQTSSAENDTNELRIERPTSPIQNKPEASNPTNKIKPTPERKVEQLSTPQLLQTAEALFISGTSVRTLYETNQIDRRGLVEIVEEALKGGNITNVFEKVQLGRERQKERAREFRHDDPSFAAAPSGQSATPDPVTNVQLPNVPDKSTLQPLNIQYSSNETVEASQTHDVLNPNSAIIPKNTEFKIAAAAAIAIAALIIWAIL